MGRNWVFANETKLSVINQGRVDISTLSLPAVNKLSFLNEVAYFMEMGWVGEKEHPSW
jgi:hypothetical protein